MNRVFEILKSVAFLLAMLAFGLTGCGGGTGAVDKTQESAPSVQNAADTKSEDIQEVRAAKAENPQAGSQEMNPARNQADDAQNQAGNLQGVWYGESTLDIEAINQKLEQLPEDQARQLEELATTFSTIVMAAEFRADSVMEFDMMLTGPDGQARRDRSVGTWKIAKVTPAAITVETKEFRNENEQPVGRIYVYQFIDKDHFQFVPDSIDPDLRPFTPRIVFQRVKQPLPEANVAEETGENSVR